jgi:hypothetical protein
MAESAGFPERTLRGMRLRNFVEKAPFISGEAFWPITPSGREDKNFEASVDFEDEPTAIEMLRRNPNASHGIAAFRSEIIRRLSADVDLMDRHVGQLWLEREPLDDDPYHGNLVFHCALETQQRKIIAQEIAHRSRLL